MAEFLDKAKNFVADKIANIKKPEASIDDVGFKSVTRDSAIFNSKVSVTNPYSHSIPICEVSYTLKSGNREILSGTMPDPGSLEENKTTMLEVPMKVPYSILMDLARDIGKDWDIDYELILGLTFDLPVFGNITIPISKKGELKLPTFSDLF
ncbi:late embryogenesis abundant protein Lea14-A-like isoform X2 [Macadamia integrifolia]|uniref:late embryogenesis abundant protein Lea14-A-like isoform X2 n=1 Tax=Macadamia integrifolia TaxID=60698 RepID=UPI001C4F8357|nr:late embryogenesis abundant protein Lea14-A-like isoform X2 [Macadamia integrifolia]